MIDVRNRTELNTVGQIPGSVCLPLHEVDRAFELEDQEFEDRYGTKACSTTDRSIKTFEFQVRILQARPDEKRPRTDVPVWAAGAGGR